MQPSVPKKKPGDSPDSQLQSRKRMGKCWAVSWETGYTVPSMVSPDHHITNRSPQYRPSSVYPNQKQLVWSSSGNMDFAPGESTWLGRPEIFVLEGQTAGDARPIVRASGSLRPYRQFEPAIAKPDSRVGFSFERDLIFQRSKSRHCA